MEQHKFIWIFNMNRVGKLEMKDNGIVVVNLDDEVSIRHDSNFQNEMTLIFPDVKYIIPSKDEISNIIEIIKSKDIEALRKFADESLTSMKS